MAPKGINQGDHDEINREDRGVVFSRPGEPARRGNSDGRNLRASLY